jgi:ubiquinone/menaquinone biosynthesis C-methylase UbiE
MNARADVEKWGRYWKTFRFSLTHEAYLESVAKIIATRIKRCFTADRKLMVLDVGCGQGQLDIRLAEKLRCDIVAVDIVEEALSIGGQLREEKKLQGQVNPILASAYQLPFSDGTFDIAVSTGSESAAAYRGVTEEVSRVVKGGGRLFIDFIMPNIYQPLRSIKSYFQYREAVRKQSLGEKSKYFHYGKLGLRKRFERELGLEMRQMWRTNSAPPFGGKGFRLLFERTLGHLLSPVLARTILVEFKNRDKSLRVSSGTAKEH